MTKMDVPTTVTHTFSFGTATYWNTGLVSIVVALTILCTPTLYNNIFLCFLLNPFRIASGKNKGQRAPVLGVGQGRFPFGHLTLKNWRPIRFTEATTKWCEATKTYSWIEYILFKPVLQVSSPEACKKVLSASVTVKKSTRNIGSVIPVWDMLFGKGLFMLPPKDWKRVHTISMRSFGSAQTKGFYPIVNEVVVKYTRSLREVVKGIHNSARIGTMENQIQGCRSKVGTNNVFALDELFRPLSLTAICKVAFGLGDGIRIQLIQKHFNGFFSLQKEASYRMLLGLIPGYIHLPFGNPLFIRNTIKELHKLSLELVTEYRRKKKRANVSHANTNAKDLNAAVGTQGMDVNDNRKTLLKVLCDAYDSKEGNLTDTEVVHNVFSFMAAGMSTTADSLSHTVLELAKSKRIMRRLQKDIDEIVGKRGSIDKVNWEDIDSCNYLAAVIKESLRLFPSIGTVAPRILTEDVEIDNIFCPKGSYVTIASLVAHRLAFNRVVSNGDGNEFRPERWEEDRLKRQKEGIKFPSNDYSFITFSAGVRPCIGRHMSLMEMKCAVFHFAYNFDVSLPKGSEFEYGDARKIKLPLLTLKDDIDLKIQIREKAQATL